MGTIGEANVNDIDADPVILPVMTDQLLKILSFLMVELVNYPEFVKAA